MTYRRRTRHLPDPARVCQCGTPMVRYYHSNSGTTRFSQACPVLVAHWRAHGGPWSGPHAPAGHQWVITSTPDHDPNCCSVREVETAPGDLSGLWPFDTDTLAPFGVDVADQFRRTVLDVIGYRCSREDAHERARLIVEAATGPDSTQTFDVYAEAAAGLGHAKHVLAVRREQHPDCGVRHRTYGGLARCVYTGRFAAATVKVTGEGAWAVLSWCAYRTGVQLHPTQRAAVKALRRLEDGGCGKRCKDRHGIRRLPDIDTKEKQ